MKVGFIGLGTMGASMASNLQKAGHELVVNDVRKEAAAPHLAAGAVPRGPVDVGQLAAHTRSRAQKLTGIVVTAPGGLGTEGLPRTPECVVGGWLISLSHRAWARNAARRLGCKRYVVSRSAHSSRNRPATRG